jgi:hypothetical protein
MLAFSAKVLKNLAVKAKQGKISLFLMFVNHAHCCAQHFEGRAFKQTGSRIL